MIGGATGIYLAWLRVTAATRQAEAQTRQAEAQTRQAETAIRQAELSRREHVAERVDRAVGQLGDANLEIRLSAVYVLREIITDFPERRDPVLELLSAYLREKSRDNPQGNSPADTLEIVAILRDKLEPPNG